MQHCLKIYTNKLLRIKIKFDTKNLEYKRAREWKKIEIKIK